MASRDADPPIVDREERERGREKYVKRGEDGQTGESGDWHRTNTTAEQSRRPAETAN